MADFAILNRAADRIPSQQGSPRALQAPPRAPLQADRMLDMGFEPQIRKILQMIPRPVTWKCYVSGD